MTNGRPQGRQKPILQVSFLPPNQPDGATRLVVVPRPVPRWMPLREDRPAPLLHLDGEAMAIVGGGGQPGAVEYRLAPLPPDAQTFGYFPVTEQALQEAWSEESRLRSQRALDNKFLLLPLEVLIGWMAHRWLLWIGDYIPIDADRACFINAFPFLFFSAFSVILYIVTGNGLFVLTCFWFAAEYFFRCGSVWIGNGPLGLLPLELLDRLIQRVQGVDQAPDWKADQAWLADEPGVRARAGADLDRLDRLIHRARKAFKTPRELRHQVALRRAPEGAPFVLEVFAPRPIPGWAVHTGEEGISAPVVMNGEEALLITAAEESVEGPVRYELGPYAEGAKTAGTQWLNLEHIQEAWEHEAQLRRDAAFSNDWLAVPVELLVSLLPARWQAAVAWEYPIDTRRGCFLTAIPTAAVAPALIYAATVSASMGDSGGALQSLAIAAIFLVEGGGRLIALMAGAEAIGSLPLELADRVLRRKRPPK